MSKWRILPLQSNNAYMNMAIDEAIADSVRMAKSLPTIRFYTWSPSAVSIGCFQSIGEEVNIDKCKELGIDFVRRRTGGGAVYHDSAGEVTYSIIGKQELFPAGILDSYKYICKSIIDGLYEIGITSEFSPINDITVEGKKISGNAQTRRDGVLLQHGTILYDLNIERMFDLLKVSKEKISDKAIKNVEDRVTMVRKYSGISLEGLYQALQVGFCKNRDFIDGTLSAEELKRATELAPNYRSNSWNFSK